MEYYRPIAMTDAARPMNALPLAGGWCWFDRVEVLSRTAAPVVVAASDLPDDMRKRLTAPRPDICGLDWSAPRIMGIVNATPDSFSDGGAHDPLQHARAIAPFSDILDIGGESTRPGAVDVAAAEEIDRTAPLIAALRDEGIGPLSLDTRKAVVARAGRADLVNDVSAMTYDTGMAAAVADTGAAVCLMHAQGVPETMQRDPRYGDVLLDVYDHLAARIAVAEAAGISRGRIIVDPGIGFGKTQDHNLALIRGLALFHGLGCPILLGVSRKRFIGTIGGADVPAARMPGSVALALAGVAQGVQVLRVHDVAETRQALRLWQVATIGGMQ
ncbi:dihydropteroate synthase [Falsirhodobacter sp. alg1]|uniref:dihydropteroate synthase n=1 Tax=Falsirhodobacter sp. alg1 TaxID=1472418 RepID=UPI0005F06317|nr:dihydropteroate synthase [Falsirhodobacter sp. alg1]